MNKRLENGKREEKRFRLHINERIKDVLFLVGIALVILFAAKSIFGKEETSSVTSAASETEMRVARLLEEIEGVGEAEVMVCETENGVQGVVVVCEGANDLQVLLNVREAVAAALGTNQSAIKIYLKKV